MPITLPALCLVTLILCNVHGSLEHEIPRRSFLSRRAIDGTRGRKYFDPEEEGAYDSYGSAGGQYDPYQEKTDFSDIRKNVPGEPGIDYPAYTTLPQTGFTCDGRSRGYYADEVSGCQVFHVCHDVLVSSFLCPIGSIFSQKLLTCDWWTKVDCSASSKYIDVNRNSYQQDDDEMIRNAYAMISLQSGTDVTKDGLVDPDRTGSIVDYQKSPGRILDYSPVDASGNDLRHNFGEYPNPASRDFLPPYQLKNRKPETSQNYQENFYTGDKSRSPYEDSPIIRVLKIHDQGYRDQQTNRDFPDRYRGPNEFTNQFQPSYAPTVPTVTTTTRRFYSPTVPTTFRPSTLAYNKLDQELDSSDYYFSHSRAKSFVTPPTFRKVISTKFNRDDDYGRQESYEDESYEDVNSEETINARSREKFQVRVSDNFNFNRTQPLNGRNSQLEGVYKDFDRVGDNEEFADDFETRGSIGLGHALHQSLRGIFDRKQNPIDNKNKAGETSFHKEEIKHTLVKPESTVTLEEQNEGTTEQYERNNKTEREEIFDEFHDFAPSTTPSIIESTIKASTNPFESSNTTMLKDPDGLNNSTDVNRELERKKDSIDRMDSGFQTFRQTEFLKHPQKTKFQIKVPDLSDVSSLLIHYSTLDNGPYPGTRTTELPRFQSTFPDDYIDHPTSFDETLGVTSNYESIASSRDSSFQNHPTTMARPLISRTGSWFPFTSPGPLDVKAPLKGYSDSSNDFTGSSDDHQLNAHLKDHKNDTEDDANNHKTLQFTVDDVVPSSKVTSISDSTLYPVQELSENASTIVKSDENSTQKFNKTSVSSVVTSVSMNPIESISKSVIPRSTEEPKKEEKAADEQDIVEASTANALFKSIRPETLKQIEETIEQNNSPYQVTVTVNKDEDLVPAAGDLISKLIAEQGKETSTLSDKIHELEVVKSVEPEIHSLTHTKITTMRISDNEDQTDLRNNFTSVERDLKKKNINMVRLLQLMSELLKLDRVPRPFSLDAQSSSSKTVTEDVNLDMELRDEATTRFQQSSTESNSRTSAPRSKEAILDQLSENFGEPLYGTQRKSIFDLPDKERAVDFQTGFPLKNMNKYGELNDIKTTIPTTLQTRYKIGSGPTPKARTTTSAPKTVPTTETVVKTEFLPSIGFSFDTDQGREEYVEAVLGGLIEPQTSGSEKKETILIGKVKEGASSNMNETSEKI